MLIGVDGNEANAKERVGVQQYAYELLSAIYRISDEWRERNKFIIYLKKPPNRLLPKEKDYWVYKIIPGGGFWVIKNLMPQLFLRPRLNIFFSPSHYLPPISPVSKVFTVHDLGYLEFSEQFKKYDFWQLKWWTAISVSVSKYIIAVSKSTKMDIVRHYPSASKKTFVIYHGYDKERYNEKISQIDVRRTAKRYRLPDNYILFLSTLKPSKNLENLLAAFASIKEKFPQYKLVIGGKKGWLYASVFEKIKELRLGGKVIFTDFIPEREKPALYKGAKLLASPSYWEGFGMHVLEALACGTPAVVSNVSSLPEVAGEAGVYVDPGNVLDIAKGLERVLKMPQGEYNELVAKGLEQARRFSWDKTARETIGVFEKV